MRIALVLATALALPQPAAAQDSVLVQHVTNVTLARAGGALVVTAAGTVPIAGFTGADPARDSGGRSLPG